MQDEKLLARMGISARTPDDPHAGCLARWLDEREKRELAERSIQANAQAYEALTEARDRELALWRLRAWTFGVIAALFAVGTIVVSVTQP